MQNQTTELPRIAYTAGEVARMIGRSRAAVYAMCRRGELAPVIQEVPGGALSIPVEAVEDWRSRQRPATARRSA